MDEAIREILFRTLDDLPLPSKMKDYIAESVVGRLMLLGIASAVAHSDILPSLLASIKDNVRKFKDDTISQNMAHIDAIIPIMKEALCRLLVQEAVKLKDSCENSFNDTKESRS